MNGLNKKKAAVGAILAALLLIGAGCDVASGRVDLRAGDRRPSEQPAAPASASGEAPAQLLGGDRDEHGCIGSAGYSWCEAKQKCLRVWEEKCE